MEKQRYVLKLSLQQLALRKIAILLWHHTDIVALVKSFHYCFFNRESTIQQWQETIEKLVIEKVAIFLLPESLKEELEQVIKPIGPEILMWREYHQSIIKDSYFEINKLCWTSVGTVDYQKTADTLIRQGRIDITNSYKLACIYCLEDHIQVIWGKLSQDDKKLFYVDENIPWIRGPELIIFWTCLIRGEAAQLDALINRNGGERERTLYQYAFESAALSGNKAATEYFFQKLTSQEREVSLMEIIERINYKRYFSVHTKNDFPLEKLGHVLCYLLSQMKEEEQMQVFKHRLFGAVFCFLHWPWQDLLMKVITPLWNFLSADSYCVIMFMLSGNYTMTAYNYPKLFEKLFLHAPSPCRKYLMDRHREFRTWFYGLLYGNQLENIKLVLRNIGGKDRQEFILCEEGIRLSTELIEEGKWSLLDLLVSECRLSSEAKEMLKNSLILYFSRIYTKGQMKWRKRIWERLFQLIDNANVNDGNKRIIEEAEKEEQLRRNKPKRRRRRKKY